MDNPVDKKVQTFLDNQIQKFKKILKMNPSDTSVLMAYAEANLSRGNRLEAMKAYQKLVRVKPDEPEIRVALSKIYFSTDHHRDALNEIIKILELDPKNIEAHLLMRKIERKFGFPKEMENTLQEHMSFKTSPGRIKLLKKQYDLEKRKYEQLIEDYDTQLEEDEGNPIILYNRSKARERVVLAEETLQDLDGMVGDIDGEEDIPVYMEDIPQMGVIEHKSEVIPDMVREPAEAEPEEEPVSGEEEEYQEESSDFEGPPEEDSYSLEVQDIQDVPIEDMPEVEASPIESAEEEILEIQAEEYPDNIEEVDMGEQEDISLSQYEPIPEEVEAAIAEAEREGDLTLKDFEDVPVPEEIPEEENLDMPAEDEPETGEEEESDSHEEEPEMEEEGPAISGERLNFYDSINSQLGEILENINQTRGISSSMLVDQSGYVIYGLNDESIDYNEILPRILSIIEMLSSSGFDENRETRNLLYWVLEFEKGLMVIHPLAENVYLMVLGHTGSNFGAVKYSIEKSTGKFHEILADMPE